jgi:6-pyruvoyltetrahydropterin/6-carboxytetrahydropterin synthase
MGDSAWRGLEASRGQEPYASGMFEVEVQAEFAAAHALRIGGALEPVHGHNWRVTVTAAGERLDEDGLLCDFHVLEGGLRGVVGELDGRNLNDLAAFDAARGGANPSAENVAAHIADRLRASVRGRVPPEVRITRVRVTEAPGCAAVYFPAGVER